MTDNSLNFKNNKERKQFRKDVEKEKVITERRRHEIEELHNWTIAKISRLAPKEKDNGWLKVHLAMLIGMAYDKGIENKED